MAGLVSQSVPKRGVDAPRGPGSASVPSAWEGGAWASSLAVILQAVASVAHSDLAMWSWLDYKKC